MATSTIKDKNIVCSGALFYARTTKRFLFLERTKTKTAGQWGLVGGMAEGNETPWTALEREISEEVGKTPTIKKMTIRIPKVSHQCPFIKLNASDIASIAPFSKNTRIQADMDKNRIKL